MLIPFISFHQIPDSCPVTSRRRRDASDGFKSGNVTTVLFITNPNLPNGERHKHTVKAMACIAKHHYSTETHKHTQTHAHTQTHTNTQ